MPLDSARSCGSTPNLGHMPSVDPSQCNSDELNIFENMFADELEIEVDRSTSSGGLISKTSAGREGCRGSIIEKRGDP